MSAVGWVLGAQSRFLRTASALPRYHTDVVPLVFPLARPGPS